MNRPRASPQCQPADRHRANRMAPKPSCWLFDTASCEPTNKSLLDQHEEQDYRNDCDDRDAEDEVPARFVLTDELGECNGKRLVPRCGEDNEARREFVPARHEGEDDGGHDARPHEWQIDPKQYDEPSRPVDLGGLVDLLGNAGEKAMHDPDGEGEIERSVDQDHCQ